jgi:cytochrome c
MRPAFLTTLMLGPAIAAAVMAGAIAQEKPAAQAGWSDADAKRMFNDAGCNACHAVDEMRIGPPYRAIADRYRDERVAEAERLALKIVRGGAGAWGFVPMVANSRVSPDQARKAIDWILGLPAGSPAAKGAE